MKGELSSCGQGKMDPTVAGVDDRFYACKGTLECDACLDAMPSRETGLDFLSNASDSAAHSQHPGGQSARPETCYGNSKHGWDMMISFTRPCEADPPKEIHVCAPVGPSGMAIGDSLSLLLRSMVLLYNDI